MGVSEVLLATSVGGGIFAVFAGQPINIIGVTGPILVFEEALYSVSIILCFFYPPLVNH